jgi:2-polyprenyl-6-methoxyphenol hydroxylase-like FAD-dependent oxidoreductase
MALRDHRPRVHREPARSTPIVGDYDVVVAGAGPAGCAAALSAARHGAATLLVEKDGFLGGAAVSQLVCVVLSTNGVDLQGVWHELMRAMDRHHAVRVESHSGDGPRVRGTLDPEIVKFAWDGLLADAGVALLHHAVVVGALRDGDAVRGILVETVAGRQAILARRVVDCTGDGALAAQAGVPWQQGDGEHDYAMALTKVLRIGNVCRADAPLGSEAMARLEKAWKTACETGEYTTPIITTGRVLHYARNLSWPLPAYRHEIALVISRVLETNPLDPWELTEAEREGREQARELADFYRKYVPGCENSYLLDTSNHIGVRSSRRIQGLATVTAQDVTQFRKYPDGIARASWEIDVWPPDSYTASAVDRESKEYRERRAQLAKGEYYSIRYGCLVAKGVDNLMVAGRCLSAEHLAQSSLRIQQTCMATGQAAGTAAAMSVREGVTPRELDPLQVAAQVQRDQARVEPAFEFLRDRPRTT